MADSDGRALLVNLHKKVVLYHFNFKQPVRDIKYSPNGRSVQWQVSPIVVCHASLSLQELFLID